MFVDQKVLLIQESSSRKWTLPGGWADVNFSPAENVERECLEVTGYIVKARMLTSVIDRDKAGYPRNINTIYKLFFLCDLLGGEARISIERDQVEFHPVKDLPELDPHRVMKQDIELAYSYVIKGGQSHFN